MKKLLLLGLLCFFISYSNGQNLSYQGRYLNKPVHNPTTIIIDFENDVFVKTDRYFTNGTAITFVNKKLSNKFINYILRTPKAYKSNRYSLEFRQNMYTPEDKYGSGIKYGDRPYSGLLVTTYKKETFKNNKRITAGLMLGLIGNYSGAAFTQNFIHSFNDMQQSEGWEFQIKDTPVINILYQYDHVLIKSKYTSLSNTIRAQAGSFQTGLYEGLNLKLGLIASNFDLPELSRGFQCYIFAKAGSKLSILDGTLQGGIFGGKPNDYNLKYPERNLFVSNISSGIVISYKGIYLKAAVNYISPEFVGAKTHGWGSISIATTF